jgi:response regulator RpfG family c-di-GMP phosphodiesterase
VSSGVNVAALRALPEKPRRQTSVLIVDDDAAVRGVVAKILSNCGCTFRMASTGAEALQLLEKEPSEVAFLDVHMPMMSGLELADQLRREHPDTAIVMLTGMAEFGTVLAAIQAGAADFVAKPFKSGELVKAYQRAVERRDTVARAKRAAELEREVARQSAELATSLANSASTAAGLVEAFVLALRARSEAAAAHAFRVAELSVRIGQSLELPPPELEVLRRAALLHEIGYLAIPESSLDGSADDAATLRRYPQIGHDIVSRVPALADCARGILAHREHLDGSGYTLGLQAAAIPLIGRILAVADAHDTMTRPTSGEQPVSSADAIALIEQNVNLRFDPTVVTALLLAMGDPREATYRAAAARPGAGE